MASRAAGFAAATLAVFALGAPGPAHAGHAPAHAHTARQQTGQLHEPAAERTKIEDVDGIANAADKLALVGDQVSMMSVKVDRIAGDRAFWITNDGRMRAFVVVDAPSLKKAAGTVRGIRQGDIVAIEGVVQKLPGAKGTVKVTDWGNIHGRDAKALQGREVYVYAKTLQVLAHPSE